MADKTGIEWCDSSWNPLVGCAHVSPGCDNCYAAREASGRLSHLDAYQGLATGGRFTGQVRLLPERLEQPLRWRRPRRVFVNSMSDLFHKDVPGDFIAEVFAVMALADRHVFQLLTKRPQLMASRLRSDAWLDEVDAARLRRQPLSLMPDWPRPNIWLGTSIESDRYTFRADHLRDTPAAVRWLSLEPLLGPLPSLDLKDIDWVVVGGESGPNARPMHPDWARDIRDHCHAAGIPFFFKQWGEHVPAVIEEDETFDGGRFFKNPKHGGKSAVSLREKAPRPFQSAESRPMRPGDVTVGGVHMLDEQTVTVRVGKKNAGRELDGRTWDDYPEVSA